MIYYLALGSNLGDRLQNLRRAVFELAATGQVKNTAAVYESAPVGVPNQPAFLNSVAQLETDLRPQRLLRRIKQIECQIGRVPAPRWQARQIDIDILAWSGENVEQSNLNIPHAQLTKRAFALLPLAEMAPGLHINGRRVADYIPPLQQQVVKTNDKLMQTHEL